MAQNEEPISLTGETLDAFLENVRICFCTLCNHEPKYGHCYSCNCGNHVAASDTEDSAKLKATVAHLKTLLISKVKNPQVGICIDCGAAIWNNNERGEDNTPPYGLPAGMFHPICRAVKVAEARAEIALTVLKTAALKACDGFDAQPNHGDPNAKTIMDELRRLATTSEGHALQLLRAAELLRDFYDDWENGVSCYEDPEDYTGPLGNAVKLTFERENEIIKVLNELFGDRGAEPEKPFLALGVARVKFSFEIPADISMRSEALDLFVDKLIQQKAEETSSIGFVESIESWDVGGPKSIVATARLFPRPKVTFTEEPEA